MAKGLNKVMLIGRLGKDPEVRLMQNENQVCNFTVATSEQWNDKASGQKQEKTEWHSCVVFGKLAEVCGQYLTKGSQVYVEGKLQTRSWEQDGITRYKTEINISDMQMLDSKKAAGKEPVNGHESYQPPVNTDMAQGNPPDDFNDVPF